MNDPQSWWRVARLVVVLAFLAAVGAHYDSKFGFTSFIRFQANGQDRDLLPAVRAVPHAETPAGYDGQFYAQLALDPGLRSPAMDRVLDDPQYRARRILIPWIAHVLGFGDTERTLQIYALENVVTWLIFAWLMHRVIPQTSGRQTSGPQTGRTQSGARAFGLWAGCVCAYGLLASVWLALTDGPSLLLLVSAIVVYESGHRVWAALLLGIAGLARETSVLGATMFASALGRSRRQWGMAAAGIVLTLTPLALWMDYLRSIYHSGVATAGADHIKLPLTGLIWKLGMVWQECTRAGFGAPAWRDLSTLIALFVQAGALLWLLRREGWRSPWMIVALAYLALIVVAKPAVWDGSPGAFTRVSLPLTVGVNVLLSRRGRTSWWIIAGANLGVLPGIADLLA